MNEPNTELPLPATGEPAVADNHGIKVAKSCTIKASRDVLYAFWRKFENLPLFMNGLVSVTENGNF
jgi:uncharacterized membrane protein